MSVEYCGNIYYCEIRVTDYSGMKKRSPVIKKEKKKEWQKTGNQKFVPERKRSHFSEYLGHAASLYGTDAASSDCTV